MDGGDAGNWSVSDTPRRIALHGHIQREACMVKARK